VAQQIYSLPRLAASVPHRTSPCPRQDSNLYAVAGTGPSNQPVYQFQHVGPCSERDSNPHGVNPHRILNPARLPIPPSERPPAFGGPGQPATGPASADGHGAEGTRTPGLLNAIQALSQLSYSPTTSDGFAASPPTLPVKQRPTGLTGLEPATSGVTDRHSNRLSYSPLPTATRLRGYRAALSTCPERATGLEPATFCMASRRSTN
jgi:hypothetical protein